MKLGRRGRGVELDPGYYRDSIQYLRAIEEEIRAPTLFALDDLDAQPSDEIEGDCGLTPDQADEVWQSERAARRRGHGSLAMEMETA